MKSCESLKGVLVDPIERTMFGAELFVRDGVIESIKRDDSIKSPYIIPGMVDSHVHIESSMLTPVEFSKAAARCGTVAAVCDPHEIANVAGVAGVNFMIENAKSAIIKLFFGVPSCVPASPFDECFQPFTPEVVEELIKRDDLHFLGEMMNFPGVIYNNESVRKIIDITHKYKKTVDGHAPALSGDDLKKYVDAGISTDHECFTINEATEKINHGMKVLIREGSAAKNYNQLKELINTNASSVMFCTDDCHPDDLQKGHINLLLKKSLALGFDIFNILQATSVNPVKHYKLNVGLLQEGDSADFLIVNNLQDIRVESTYINGVDVLKKSTLTTKTIVPNYIFPESIGDIDISVPAKTGKFRAIGIINDELVTDNLEIVCDKNELSVDLDNDLLKIVVLSRYVPNKFSVGFIRGFGLTKGAIAASIAHDSHHIIAVGADDNSIKQCLNYIVKNRGGVCYYNSEQIFGLPLPVFGLMTNLSVEGAGMKYGEINSRVVADGCKLKAPFMTMAFMSLTVIPKLKITPSGLFDVVQFKPTDMFIE